MIGGKHAPTDPDGDPLTISAVSSPTANGAIVTTDGSSLTYSNGNVGADSFTYTVSDGRGGTATATVSVSVADSGGASLNIVSSSHVGNTMTVTFAGIPGYTYVVETTTDSLPTQSWWPISTNTADTNGLWQFGPGCH